MDCREGIRPDWIRTSLEDNRHIDDIRMYETLDDITNLIERT